MEQKTGPFGEESDPAEKQKCSGMSHTLLHRPDRSIYCMNETKLTAWMGIPVQWNAKGNKTFLPKCLSN